MKRIKYIRLLFFLLLINIATFSVAQVDFKDKHIQKAINEVFSAYENIDSMVLTFDSKLPVGLTIFKTPLENSRRGISDSKIFYIISFEGDRYLLKKQLPLIYKLIYSKGYGKRIRKVSREDSFRWVLARTSTDFRRFRRGGGYLDAEARRDNLEGLITLLNDNYHESMVPTGDSVLIFQAVVERDGTLAGDMELLVGEKDALYTYFLETYDYYIKNVLTKRNFFARLYRPRQQNGPQRGLIDIFVRLNKDRTFTVSGTGVSRMFQLKNFTDDPDNPIFY